MAATALGLQPRLFEPYMRGVHAALRQSPWLEVLVFLPLVALVPFGLYLLAKAGLRYNVKKCKRGGKLRFFLQRVSAVVILAFIAFHLLTLRDWGPKFATSEAAKSALSMTAAIYHLGNGLWTGAIAWGLTQSPSAQQRSLWVSIAFGIMLLVLGTLGW